MRLLVRLVLCLLPLTLSAANYVFIFNGSATTASVYNADTMELLGTPVVGAGAVKAFGVPDPNSPTQFLKLYVVTSSSIVVLNPAPPFTVRTTLALSGTLAAGPNAAVLSPDGRRLLVAAGSNVQVVNTLDSPDALAATLTTAASPAGIVVLPNSKRAYVMSPPSPFIQIIDLVPATPTLLAISANLPLGSSPSAIGIAPNGSRIYVASLSSIYDIDRVSNAPAAPIANLFFGASSISFDRDPPVSSAVLNGGTSASILNLATRAVSVTPFTVTASGATQTITKVVTPGANRAFLIAGSPGRLYQGFLTAGGAASEVNNPLTGTVFGASVVDLEASPDGTRLFVAFTSDNRLVKLDPSGAFGPTQISLSQTPSGVSVISTPAAVASLLEIYGGDSQTGPASTVFPATLAVRARTGSTPAAGQIVSFSSATTGVSFSDATVATNLNGVAETQVSVPVTTAVQVQALIVGSSVAAVTFNLNSGTPSNPTGLTKVSGDRQLVLQNSVFPDVLVVQGGPGNTISVTTPAGITCATPVTTDGSGLANVTCAAGAFTAVTAVDISMTDVFGRTLADAFHAKIVLLASDLPTVLAVDPVTSLVGTVRQTLPSALLVRAVKADGTSVPDVGVRFSSPQDVTFDPVTVVTTAGTATASVTFGCFVGTGQINAVALTSPGLLRSNTIPFNTTVGPAAQMVKRQGDNQRGSAGQRLDGPGQALKVQISDACGNPLAGQSVAWTVSPSGLATLESVFGTTDFEGNSSALVRLGNRSGTFSVSAASGNLSVTFTITVNVVPTRLSVAAGNNQTVVPGQTADPLTVRVQDDNGVDVPGVDVVFAVTAGSATLDATRATTDAQGRASATLRVGNAVGTITVTATAISRSVTFTITVVGRFPVVSALGFVNGASFRQGWVSGSLGSIFGTGLMEGITGVALADRAPFPTTLRSVRVTVQGIDAPLISLVNQQGQEQINLQVPFGLSPGSVTVIINNNGSQKSFATQILAIQPGIFEFDSGGQRLAAALHADFSVVTQSNPARPNEIILLFLTGLGALAQPVGTNVAGPILPVATVTRPAVGINDQGVSVLGSFYAPTLYTAYQINFMVPANAPSGLTKLSVVADGVPSQDSKLPILAP